MTGIAVFAVLLGALIAVAQGVRLVWRRLRAIPGRHRPDTTPSGVSWTYETGSRRRWWRRRRRSRPPRSRGYL